MNGLNSYVCHLTVRQLTILLVSVVASISHAREVTTQNYLDYYQHTRLARVMAANGSFAESAALDEKTFKTFDFEFARDCIHAVEVSTMTRDDSLTAYFVECALKRGVPNSYFVGGPTLERFRNTDLWNYITSQAETWHKEYERSIDHELREEINQMFEADQKIRRRYYRPSNVFLRPFIQRQWKALNENRCTAS